MITKKQVEAALEKYNRDFPKNDYRPQGTKYWFDIKAYHWALTDEKGQLYPLKLIYSYVKQMELLDISTWEARTQLGKLGFKLVELTDQVRDDLWSKAEE